MSALATPIDPMTVEEFYKLPEDNCIMELIHGEIYMSPPPSNFHQKISGNLQFALNLFLFQNPLGIIYNAPFGVVLDDHTSLEPDIVYVAKENYWKMDERGMTGAPDLVVEILSPGTSSRDTGVKRQNYKNNKVKELWIVSPQRRTVEIERLGPGGYQPAILLQKETDLLSTPLLPGFEMSLSALFSSPFLFHQPT